MAKVYQLMVQETRYFFGYQDDESEVFSGPVYAEREDARKACEFYRSTHKSTKSNDYSAWIIEREIYEHFNEGDVIEWFNEDWLDHAHDVLDENFPDVDWVIKDDFACEEWQNGRSDEENINDFKKYMEEQL